MEGDNLKKLMLFDSTLRDGSHAIKHQLTKDNITDYCKIIDSVGMDVVIVGHGNGLGASSLQTGLSLLTDEEMIFLARQNLKNTKLGAFLIPGYGTIYNDIAPALKQGVDLVCVASHCTEANITKQHIQYVRNNNAEVYGVLMMYHMAPLKTLVDEAKKMQEYGAYGVIIMDSAGASTPVMVQETIRELKNTLDIKIGFHPHNNLGLAVGNAYIAYKEGADIIDGTVRGFGAGAGNCQLEPFIALLQKEGVELDINLYEMLNASEDIVSKFNSKNQGLDALSIISGLSGVFSSFAPHVSNASKEFNVDSRDIFIELGKRKVVGGQEDIVVDVAMNLAQKKAKDETSYLVGSLL